MWYLLFNLVFALWVLVDARRRQMEFPALWAAASVLLMVLVVPFYLSRRPLKRGESREGGAVWSFSKWFALFWTVSMVSVAIMGKIATSAAVRNAAVKAEATGSVVVAGFGFIAIMGLWLVVLAAVVGMGFHHRSSSTEIGPSGPLGSSGNTGQNAAAEHREGAHRQIPSSKRSSDRVG